VTCGSSGSGPLRPRRTSRRVQVAARKDHLYSSTTTLAPKMAYSSSRRTHACSSAAGRARAGRAPGLRATNTGSRVGVAGWLAGALVGGGDGPLPDRLGVARGHAQAVAGEGLAQRRPGGAQLGRGGIHAAQSLGQGEGPLGLGAVGEEPAGLSAHPVQSEVGSVPAWRAIPGLLYLCRVDGLRWLGWLRGKLWVHGRAPSGS
jgi:hypothetical protein